MRDTEGIVIHLTPVNSHSTFLSMKGYKVGLYGGTRTTGATAMAAQFSREELKNHGTMHGTNKAFDRYCQREAAPSREIYQTLANARKVVKLEVEEK